MWVGPEVCKLAVVTEKMPWWSEPFDGPSGEMFRGAMTEVGIGVEKVAFGTAEEDPVDRQASFVLVAGDVALSKYRPDLRVAHCHGRPMQVVANVIAFPVFHPEAYWRNPRWRSLLTHELKTLMTIARSPEDWDRYVPESCVKCRGLVEYTDDMGVHYCHEHGPQQ